MKKEASSLGRRTSDSMRDEYDFSAGTRGKYAQAYADGTNLVRLEPDVAEAFPTADSVNQALRAPAQVARRQVHKPAS